MKRWLFILGRLPDLGLAEALWVLGIMGIQHTSQRLARQVLLVQTDQEQDVSGVLARLGGTIKIARVDAVTPRGNARRPEDTRAVLKETLQPDTLVKDYAKQGSGRWTFGVSVYGAEHDPTIARSVHDFGLDIKRYLKSRRRSARFVAPRGKSAALSSVVVTGNNLLKPGGTEIILVFTGTELYRGSTKVVQDFAGYSDRDYGRPERNPRAGSLPPKLAQVLINIAGQKPGAKLFDPFCGIGTVLQEALLMGYEAGGSDSEAEQIQRARANLDWLVKRYSAPQPRELTVAQAQSVRPTTQPIDALVTEGVLGPPRSQPYPAVQASQVAREISKLWRSVLLHWKQLLKPDARVVLTLPVLKTNDPEPTFVPLLDDLEALGYRLEALAPERFVKDMATTPRGTIVYDRPDQIVGREICKLTRL